jgi:glycosyltransferase involved in cell wall biosynthesis
MRIGIDAKWYFEGPVSNREVVRNLVNNILLFESDETIVLFIDRKFRNTPLEVAPKLKVEIVYLWADNNLLSNLFVVPFKALRKKLDVMVLQNFSTPFLRCRKLLCILDVIYTIHPRYFTLIERLYFKPIKLLSRYADRIYTISMSEKRNMAGEGFAPSEKIEVVYLGVEDRYKPLGEQDAALCEETKKKYHLPDRYLLYLGRLNERKNIRNLLLALKKTKDREIPLVIVGGYNWKMFDLGSFIPENDLEKRVVLTGHVAHEALPRIYAMAAAFCYVSFAEGFGLPVLEAMASGVPVIVSRIPVFEEICKNAGNYIDPNDPDDIARGIDELLYNETLRSTKINSGIAIAKTFRWDTAARQLLQIIHKTITEPKLLK